MDNTEEISEDELIEIFNNVLDSGHPDFDLITVNRYDFELRKIQPLKKYLSTKQTEIESNLCVFKNIPKDKISMVLLDFLIEIEEYLNANEYKPIGKLYRDRKDKRRKKDIKILRDYQKMFFNTKKGEHSHINVDAIALNPRLDEIHKINEILDGRCKSNEILDGRCKLNEILDEIYELNEILIKELETQNFNCLSIFKYSHISFQDPTKGRLKAFFNKLKKDYKINTLHAKQMIDIL